MSNTALIYAKVGRKGTDSVPLRVSEPDFTKFANKHIFWNPGSGPYFRKNGKTVRLHRAIMLPNPHDRAMVVTLRDGDWTNLTRENLQVRTMQEWAAWMREQGKLRNPTPDERELGSIASMLAREAEHQQVSAQAIADQVVQSLDQQVAEETGNEDDPSIFDDPEVVEWAHQMPRIDLVESEVVDEIRHDLSVLRAMVSALVDKHLADNASAEDRVALAKLLLSKLPDYDKTWSDNTANRWLFMFEKISTILLSNFTSIL